VTPAYLRFASSTGRVRCPYLLGDPNPHIESGMEIVSANGLELPAREWPGGRLFFVHDAAEEARV
jgi:hypothetical protein